MIYVILLVAHWSSCVLLNGFPRFPVGFRCYLFSPFLFLLVAGWWFGCFSFIICYRFVFSLLVEVGCEFLLVVFSFGLCRCCCCCCCCCGCCGCGCGCWLLVVGCWLLVVGCWLLVVGWLLLLVLLLLLLLLLLLFCFRPLFAEVSQRCSKPWLVVLYTVEDLLPLIWDCMKPIEGPYEPLSILESHKGFERCPSGVCDTKASP